MECARQLHKYILINKLYKKRDQLVLRKYIKLLIIPTYMYDGLKEITRNMILESSCKLVWIKNIHVY